MAAEIVTRTREFGSEVVEEVKKVTWPDWPQLKNATLVVLVFLFIVAVIIYAMDLVTRHGLDFIMKLFTR